MLISYRREMWKQTECKLKNQARAGETVTNPGSHREIVTNPGLQKGNSNKFSGKATVKRRQVLMFCFLGSEGRKNIVYVVLVVAITKENGWPILLRSSFFWDVGSQRTWKASSTQYREMLGENITITCLKMWPKSQRRKSPGQSKGVPWKPGS